MYGSPVKFQDASQSIMRLLYRSNPEAVIPIAFRHKTRA
jgi:hypothetical protein